MFGLGMLVMYLITSIIVLIYCFTPALQTHWFEDVMSVIYCWWAIPPFLLIKKIRKIIKKRGN